jgi:hypothetical protein
MYHAMSSHLHISRLYLVWPVVLSSALDQRAESYIIRFDPTNIRSMYKELHSASLHKNVDKMDVHHISHT